jgi:hypothetical protein
MMNAPRTAQQGGAALVLFLGVSAALAILSVAIVMAVANATQNTSREKRHATAFNIAEAGLDVAMQQLGRRWPNRETRAYMPWTELENKAFAEDFFGSETLPPLPDGGHYISVRAFDDVESDTPLPSGWEASASTWDANRNGIMLVDAQARVGEQLAHPVVGQHRHRAALFVGVGEPALVTGRGERAERVGDERRELDVGSRHGNLLSGGAPAAGAPPPAPPRPGWSRRDRSYCSR